MRNNDWPEHRLADLCDSIDYGYTASAAQLPVGPKFLRITDIVNGCLDWQSVPHCKISADSILQYQLHHGDVVIARTGATTGFSAYIAHPPDAVFASYLVRLKINNKVNPQFVAYFLKTPDFWDYMRGVLGDKSAQPNASAKTMTQVRLRLPPRPEQDAIAGILGTLDDKIELNRRMNETLDATVHAIFKSWFVDLESQDAAWREDKIESIASLSRETLNPGDFPEESFDHYSIPAFDERQLPSIDGGAAIKSNKLIVLPDSILVSKLNPRIPRVWLPHIGESRRSVCSTEFLVVSPRKGIPREWLYSLLSSAEFLGKFVTFVTGTSGSHQRVKPESLLAMPVRIPPKPAMERFVAAAGPICKRIADNLREAQILAAIRDALLPKLLSGEIPVETPPKPVESRA